jgi:hypothetical protein
MVPHLSVFADESSPTYPDAPLTAPVGDGVRSPAAILFPIGDLFRPILADPKEPRFYLSYRLFKFGSDQTHAAVGGYGEFFGLYRHADTDGGFSWQANFGGGIHAQFSLHAPSLDLVNADYTLGFPFSFRKGRSSYRLAIYHQSSHLGDEYLLHNNVERVELSYEAVQAIASHEWQTWRVYYGGEYIMHQGPTSIKPAALQGGIEYYGTDAIVGRGKLVGGWDLKSDQTHDWSLNSSVKAGIQFDSSTNDGRYIRVLAEGYKGFTPYGQFYTDRSTYVGIGVYLGFE